VMFFLLTVWRGGNDCTGKKNLHAWEYDADKAQKLLWRKKALLP